MSAYQDWEHNVDQPVLILHCLYCQDLITEASTHSANPHVHIESGSAICAGAGRISLATPRKGIS